MIRGDEEINALQVQAMDHVVLTIATQAPVARDLRFLLTLDRVGYELERIGDSVANVAKRVQGARAGRSPRGARRACRRWAAWPPSSWPRRCGP